MFLKTIRNKGKYIIIFLKYHSENEAQALYHFTKNEDQNKTAFNVKSYFLYYWSKCARLQFCL